MEPTYKVLGSDGNHYGPVTAAQFREWVREGRANHQTQVSRSDSSEWRAAGSFPEFELHAAAQAAPVATATEVPPNIPAGMPAGPGEFELEQKLRSGASWFYWMAALSVINSLMVNQGWGFAIGMGITRQMDYELPFAAAVTFSVVASGIIALFGFFGIKRHLWAFIVGMILLALDTGLTVLQQAWISVAFHVWALVSIFMAFQACRALRRRY